MNTKWKVILSIMLLITTICIVFAILVQRLHDNKVAEMLAGKSESAFLLAETIVAELTQRYQKRIITFSNPAASPSREQMIMAFANRDRDKLLELSKPLLTVLKNENSYFSSIGWILPDNQVFLRVQRPENFGGNVSKLRPDVAAVNRERRQHSGFDAGYWSMQYRIVQPVFLHDQYLGAVQFGIKASIIYEVLQEKLNAVAGMAVLNEEFKLAQESKLPKLKCRTHTIRSPDVTLFKPIQDQLDWNSERQRVMLNGRPHIILNVLPVSNFQSEKLGVFFVALDISDELAQKRKLLDTVLLISSILLIFSFLILYFSYGSLIQKIISLNRSLEKNNHELENRVHERTVKLQKSEKRLQKSELKFRSLVESSYDWIWETDVNGVYSYASIHVEGILGYKPEEVIGKTPFDLMPPEEAERVSAIFKEALKKVEPIISLVNVALHKEGQRIILETSGVPFFDENGKIAGYRGVDRDITERKKAEEQKEKLISELQNALKKVKVLSGLIPICAHCKKIRDDKGFWNQVEYYIKKHSEAKFTHGICPVCAEEEYKKLAALKGKK